MTSPATPRPSSWFKTCPRIQVVILLRRGSSLRPCGFAWWSISAGGWSAILALSGVSALGFLRLRPPDVKIFFVCGSGHKHFPLPGGTVQGGAYVFHLF